MAYFLEKPETSTTPYVLVDEARGYMTLIGESLHDNIPECFGEVRSWLDNYLQTDFPSLTFDCRLNSFNSSTAVLLLNMLVDMDECASDRRPVTVNWFTTADNDVAIGCGKVFQEGMDNISFNLVITETRSRC